MPLPPVTADPDGEWWYPWMLEGGLPDRVEPVPLHCAVQGPADGTPFEVYGTSDQAWGEVRDGHIGFFPKDPEGREVVRVEGFADVELEWTRDEEGHPRCPPGPIVLDQPPAYVRGEVVVPGVPEGGRRWVSGCRVHPFDNKADAQGHFEHLARPGACWMVGSYFDGTLVWSSQPVLVEPVAGEVVEVELSVEPWPGEQVASADLGVLLVREYEGGPEYDGWRYGADDGLGVIVGDVYYGARSSDLVAFMAGAEGCDP